MRTELVLLAGGIAVALAACGGGAPRTAPPVPAPIPLLRSAPADARLAVRLAPRELLGHPGARTLWRAFVPHGGERAFVARMGVEPRDLTEVIFIEPATPGGSLLVLRGFFDAERAAREAGERLVLLDVETDRPRVRREGLGARGRWAYVALAPDILLIAHDVPPQEAARWVERYTHDVVELDGDADVLAREYARAPLALLVPEPLELPGAEGAALLMARERALALVLEPRGERMTMEIDARGEFPEGADRNFRALADALAATAFGRMLGLGGAIDTLQVAQDARGVRVSVVLDPAQLARGLRVLFQEELSALFE